MYGGFSPAELDHLGVALYLDKAVQHTLHLFQRQAEADAGVGETDGAVEVAGGVDLDEAQAHVLLVFRAKAAVQRAAVFDLSAELQGDGAGFVELDGVDVHLGVGADDAFEPAVFGTPLSHVDLVVPDDYLSVDDGLAFGTDAAGELMEDIIGVLFDPCRF